MALPVPGNLSPTLPVFICFEGVRICEYASLFVVGRSGCGASLAWPALTAAEGGREAGATAAEAK